MGYYRLNRMIDLAKGLARGARDPDAIAMNATIYSIPLVVDIFFYFEENNFI